MVVMGIVKIVPLLDWCRDRELWITWQEPYSQWYMDGRVQERRSFIANALELRFFWMCLIMCYHWEKNKFDLCLEYNQYPLFTDMVYLKQSMDMQSHPLYSVGLNYLSIHKVQPLKFRNG